jgi:predicted AAA+ superfamily ATPase
MLKKVLKSIVLSQQEWLIPDPREIRREGIDWFSSIPPFSYIITGVRRSGKSTLLRQVMQLHQSRNYFNFEDTRTAGFQVNDFRVVEELFGELFGNDTMLFFDEIQNIAEWERYVRDATERKKTVVITGSNASMLSKELGTRLTGRHLDFEVFPFSYNEFLTFNQLPASSDSFLSFLSKGGFPEYLTIGKPEILSSLVSDILARDIFSRYNLRNQEAYRMILQFLLSNTGKEVSFNNLKNIFEIRSATSVMEFLHYLIDSYLIFLVHRFDPSLKVQARNPKKVYGIDQGLVGFSSVSGSPDMERLLENTVFLHLRQKKVELWFYKGKKECDFVIREGKNKYSLIQVSWQIGAQNEKREIEGITEAMDFFRLKEGLIVTYDQEDTVKANNKTIHLVPAWKWMLHDFS